MTLKSRSYEEGDYESLIQSLNKENMEQLFIENFGGWSDDVSKKRFFDTVNNGFVRLFFDKDVFTGYVSYTQENHSIIINDIHIVSKFQRQGYGQEILEYVINKAKENGVEQLQINVFLNNQAIEFYKKNDFVEIKQILKSNTSVMRKKI